MIDVAGYCRVSTDKTDQLNSLENQIAFFENYIQQNYNWNLYRIYADEGITGTSTRRRVQFNQMITDGKSGKFRLILTKEVSRFSRNILDTISYTRELKSMGIGVIFLNDGINSLDPDAELRLSIMGSIAQEESRKTSSRVKWGQTRRMEQGIVFGPSLLGYHVSGGKLHIIPEEAEIVKSIFEKYGIDHKSVTAICKELKESGVKNHAGLPNWTNSNIMKILKNEKYTGDLVQKKTYTPDFLTHEKKYNHGEEKKIRLRNHHEPIISRELWTIVQDRIALNRHQKTFQNTSPFSGKIKCKICGSNYICKCKKRKDGSEYRRWICSHASLHCQTSGPICSASPIKILSLNESLLMNIMQQVFCTFPLSDLNLSDSTYRFILETLSSEDRIVPNYQKSQSKLDRLTVQKNKLMDLYCCEIITLEELQTKLRHLDQDQQILLNELAKRPAASQPEYKKFKEEIKYNIEKFARFELQQNCIIRLMIDRIWVCREGVIKVYLYGMNTPWTFYGD